MDEDGDGDGDGDEELNSLTLIMNHKLLFIRSANFTWSSFEENETYFA